MSVGAWSGYWHHSSPIWRTDIDDKYPPNVPFVAHQEPYIAPFLRLRDNSASSELLQIEMVEVRNVRLGAVTTPFHSCLFPTFASFMRRYVARNCHQMPRHMEYVVATNTIFITMATISCRVWFFGKLSPPKGTSFVTSNNIVWCHLQTQLQDGSWLTFSYISFSSFTLPGLDYRIFLLYIFSITFYLVLIEQ